MRQAHLHYFIGEYAESEPLYLRALSLREQTLGPEHISAAYSVGQLARLYHLHPEFGKDPEPLFRRALAIHEKELGKDHPDVAESLYRLADHLRGQSRPVVNWQSLSSRRRGPWDLLKPADTCWLRVERPAMILLAE